MKYRIKLLRESELFTQKQIALRLSCSIRVYGHYENEEHDIPTRYLGNLADIYNVSIDYLLSRTSKSITNGNRGQTMNYRFKELRKSRQFSQSDVAAAIFVTQRTYSYYENEQRDIPTGTLIRLADFYNVSVDYILGRTDDPKMNT